MNAQIFGSARFVFVHSLLQSSRSLASGWSPGETLGKSKKKKMTFLIGCSVTPCIVLPQKSPGDQPLAKEPEDSAYENGLSLARSLSAVSSIVLERQQRNNDTRNYSND